MLRLAGRASPGRPGIWKGKMEGILEGTLETAFTIFRVGYMAVSCERMTGLTVEQIARIVNTTKGQ